MQAFSGFSGRVVSGGSEYIIVHLYDPEFLAVYTCNNESGN